MQSAGKMSLMFAKADHKLFLSVLSILCLSGCYNFSDPNSLPSGYTYNDGSAVPAPVYPVHASDYEFSNDMQKNVSVIWYAAAQDLYRDANIKNLKGQSIYVRPIRITSPFVSSFDHALRSVLMKEEHKLTPRDDSAVELHYYFGEGQNKRAMLKDDLEFADFEVFLEARKGGSIISSANGTYNLPSQGFIKKFPYYYQSGPLMNVGWYPSDDE